LNDRFATILQVSVPRYGNIRDGSRRRVTINQPGFFERTLENFCFSNIKGYAYRIEPGYSPKKREDEELRYDITEYQKAIGSLLCASLNNGPDIAYVTNQLSPYSTDPSECHWNAIKNIFRYLKKSLDYELCIYSKDNKHGLGSGGGIVCFSEADLGGDKDFMRSTIGLVMKVCGILIFWK
jgi:hypothetical protein